MVVVVFDFVLVFSAAFFEETVGRRNDFLAIVARNNHAVFLNVDLLNFTYVTVDKIEQVLALGLSCDYSALRQNY